MAVMNTPRLATQLATLGFRPTGNAYRRNGLRARIESPWLTFQTQVANGGKPIAEASGGPGLWKTVRNPSGRLERVFDLPLETIAGQEIWDDETGDALCPLHEMIDWVNATRSGKLPVGWKCPSGEELERSLPDKALTLEIGRFARQGQLTCEDDRLCVSIALHQRVPADLSPQRRTCLDRLLADVQYHSRLVRLVEPETPETERGIVAEVDLSGAPHFAIQRMLHVGLDAMRHVVTQTISTVDLLVDPTVTSTVWEIPSVQERPAEGSPK